MNTMRSLFFAIGSVSVFTNGVLLIILYLDPLKKFRTTTNYLIISLTLSDFLTGIVSCMFAFQQVASSVIIIGLFWGTILSSFFVIFFMSCERLVVVMYPLKAKSLITKRRVFSFIAADWLLSAILGGLVGGLRPPELDYFLFVLVFVNLVLILFLVVVYVVIIFKIGRKPKLIRDSLRSQRKQMIQEERRLTGVLFLLVVILLVTIVPYLTAYLVTKGYEIFEKHDKLPPALFTFMQYYFAVELLNFAVNPIIYAWRLPNFRKSLEHYMRKLPFFKTTLEVEQSTGGERMTTFRHGHRVQNSFRLLDT